MTVAGAAKLRAELQILKTEIRSRILAAIAEARAHGDLKENAEYHAAREEQSFNEGRIAELEEKLANAQVIDIKKIIPSEKIVFGCTVFLHGEDGEKHYQIVGEDEANIKEGKISYCSPIARALIGKKSGDTVDVETPGGMKNYTISKVQYV